LSVSSSNAVINDPSVVATAEKVRKAAFGDKFRPEPPATPSEDYSEFINAGVPSMFFRIDAYEPERVAAGEGTARNCRATARPYSLRCRSRPLKPVPKPTIETGVEAMTRAVLSVFDQHGRGK
jgi:hypothetical protein